MKLFYEQVLDDSDKFKPINVIKMNKIFNSSISNDKILLLSCINLIIIYCIHIIFCFTKPCVSTYIGKINLCIYNNYIHQKLNF